MLLFFNGLKWTCKSTLTDIVMFSPISFTARSYTTPFTDVVCFAEPFILLACSSFRDDFWCSNARHISLWRGECRRANIVRRIHRERKRDCTHAQESETPLWWSRTRITRQSAWNCNARPSYSALSQLPDNVTSPPGSSMLQMGVSLWTEIKNKRKINTKRIINYSSRNTATRGETCTHINAEFDVKFVSEEMPRRTKEKGRQEPVEKQIWMLQSTSYVLITWPQSGHCSRDRWAIKLRPPWAVCNLTRWVRQ